MQLPVKLFIKRIWFSFALSAIIISSVMLEVWKGEVDNENWNLLKGDEK